MAVQKNIIKKDIAITMITTQLKFDKPIPQKINGNNEYTQEYLALKNMSDLLVFSGLDVKAAEHFVLEAKKDRARRCLATYTYPTKLSKKEIEKAQNQGVLALRVAILHKHLNVSYREMSKLLALADLYQWFCRINRFTEADIPGKSLLNFLENRLGDFFLRDANSQMIDYVVNNSGPSKAVKLGSAINTKDCFFDSFCMEANIHFPVDWVLLRDASRTLILLTTRIRKYVVNRMEIGLKTMMTQMNNLCIEITQNTRTKGGKKIRKNCFRKMKRLIKKIAHHTRRHMEKLYKNRNKSKVSDKLMHSFIVEMNSVLNQLPTAIEQGHKRIISECKIKNDEKILSLYEDHVNVIVRNKAGKSVEFGNKTSLLEQSDGLILDWDLARDGAPNDHELCKKSYDRTRASYGNIESITTDRGCHSKANTTHFEKHKTYDATCPKNVTLMTQKREEGKFCKLQKRRGSTEARISILKTFTGKRLACKSYAHRQQQLSLCIFTHNIWKISKMMIEYEKLLATKKAS